MKGIEVDEVKEGKLSPIIPSNGTYITNK